MRTDLRARTDSGKEGEQLASVHKDLYEHTTRPHTHKHTCTRIRAHTQTLTPATRVDTNAPTLTLKGEKDNAICSANSKGWAKSKVSFSPER